VRSVGSLLRPVAAALLACAVLGAAARDGTASDYANLTESRFDELLRLPQWREVARKLPREATLVRACIRGKCHSVAALRIAALVAKGAGRERMSQLRTVHELVNEQPYREDSEQFGRADVWQSPLSFALRGGDCEDFAIAKYFVLQLLGVPASDLRVTVVTGQDTNEVHAVLLARVAGEWQVLDNREDAPRPLRSYRGWVLQYAVSEAGGIRYRSSHTAAAAQVHPAAQR
jgi:predicted transglutaminase-like cysteine proteinase